MKKKKKTHSLDSWFYWSQRSDKHFLYLFQHKKLESTWQLRGYTIVLKSYNQTSERIQDTEMQPAMCLQCLEIQNTKGLEAEAQSLKQM